MDHDVEIQPRSEQVWEVWFGNRLIAEGLTHDKALDMKEAIDAQVEELRRAWNEASR